MTLVDAFAVLELDVTSVALVTLLSK